MKLSPEDGWEAGRRYRVGQQRAMTGVGLAVLVALVLLVMAITRGWQDMSTVLLPLGG